MATLQLMPMTTINGTTYATAQLILTPVSAQKKQSKTILPKQEPASPCQAPDDVTPTDFNRQISSVKPDCAKRRIHFSKKALTHPRPQAVTRRNTRERNRVKAVNQGFVTLANHVPPPFRSKKMSKVDTLKAAIQYIKNLQTALDTNKSLDEIDLDCFADSDATSPASSSSDVSDTDSCDQHNPQSNTETATIAIPKHYHPSDYHVHSFNNNNNNTVPPQLNTVQSQYHNNSLNKLCNSYSTANSTAPVCGGFNTDFSHQAFTQRSIVESCPSPTSSYSSEGAPYDARGGISPEAEAELLEFASYFY